MSRRKQKMGTKERRYRKLGECFVNKHVDCWASCRWRSWVACWRRSWCVPPVPAVDDKTKFTASASTTSNATSKTSSSLLTYATEITNRIKTQPSITRTAETKAETKKTRKKTTTAIRCTRYEMYNNKKYCCKCLKCFFDWVSAQVVDVFRHSFYCSMILTTKFVLCRSCTFAMYMKLLRYEMDLAPKLGITHLKLSTAVPSLLSKVTLNSEPLTRLDNAVPKSILDDIV